VHKNLARQDVSIEFTESAMDLLADLGYDPQFGARPLKRVIQKEIINELSKQVLSGEMAAGDTIYVGTDKKGFTFSETKSTASAKPVVIQDKTIEKKEQDIAKLKKATEDVKDAVRDLKQEKDKDDKSNNGTDQ